MQIAIREQWSAFMAIFTKFRDRPFLVEGFLVKARGRIFDQFNEFLKHSVA